MLAYEYPQLPRKNASVPVQCTLLSPLYRRDADLHWTKLRSAVVTTSTAGSCNLVQPARYKAPGSLIPIKVCLQAEASSVQCFQC